MYAARNGHKDTVMMLLDAGADPSPANHVSSCVCVCVFGCVCIILYMMDTLSIQTIIFIIYRMLILYLYKLYSLIDILIVLRSAIRLLIMLAETRLKNFSETPSPPDPLLLLLLLGLLVLLLLLLLLANL
jgi:hypothetical protein